jgi:hypothetical protein
MFLAALEAHKEAGLVMDFPLGPNQGQGVPADPSDEGLQWDLVRACRVGGLFLSITLTLASFFSATLLCSCHKR